MKKIVITGGAGFIGSHIVDRFVELYPDTQIVVLDKMTYAADIQNIMHHINIKDSKLRLIVGDVREMHICRQAVKDADLVIHAAAESHVDNSFSNSLEFSKTNVEGTHCLMEACLQADVPKIIHISTDEVYGEVIEGTVTEDARLKPTNPYSASKAAADMIINGYRQSFNLPVITVRSNNIFGIRQYPEKIIPRFILSLITGEKMPLHGTGKNRRHFLSAHDLTKALVLLVDKGEIGECYNIGTTEEYENIRIAQMICEVFGLDPEKYISFTEDRPFNDERYAINWDRISALGWAPESRLTDELAAIAGWYVDNFNRYNDDGLEIVHKPKTLKAA